MTRIASILVLSALLLAFVPQAAAGVDQCSAPVAPVTKTVPAMTTLLGSRAWMDGSCSATGVVGTGTGTCNAPIGQRCIGFYPAGAVVICEWKVALGFVNALAIGVDVTGDGHVWANNDPKLGLDKPLLPPIAQSTKFMWTVPQAGMVIVYPVSALAGGSLTDQTLVSCV